MSKFAYKAEGELNSQYLGDLLKEYLSQLLVSNDTKGIVEDDYKINPNASSFKQWFNDTFKRLFKSKDLLENYNKVLSTKYVSSILDKIDIFLQTNVLTPKQFFELKQTLQAINFDSVIPLLDEYRYVSIKNSQKRFLKVLNSIKYLRHAKSNYILYNSPVDELKPFLSDKVSAHNVNYIELQKLVKQFVDLRYIELTNCDFDKYEPTFITKSEDFYKESITDNGIGEDVEQFIRSKMLEKFEISKHEEMLIEDINIKINKIDILLKKLKLQKIEKMMQELIKLKTNLAHVKEVMDTCKDTINSSTIPNKSQIFLVMDNLYYKLSKKCENLEQKIKLKLQLVDKQKMFSMLATIENRFDNETLNDEDEVLSSNKRLYTKKMQNTSINNKNLEDKETKPSITSNLYEDDDEAGEIHISEDDEDVKAEEEIIIDEDNK
ncbi:MAG: hypothetical protein IJ458_03080 [Clostridia bacterium]|nr:hypothetical protein [Clostridia bacterium]